MSKINVSTPLKKKNKTQTGRKPQGEIPWYRFPQSDLKVSKLPNHTHTGVHTQAHTQHATQWKHVAPRLFQVLCEAQIQH